MKDYKITNLNFGHSFFLSESEKESFFNNIKGTFSELGTIKQMNSFYDGKKYNYKIENLKEKRNNLKENLLTALCYLSLFVVSMGAIIIFINTNY